jgi:hypothetical protein
MTLDQIIKIQSIIDKRAIRSDTLELLDQKRYSNSKECMIRYGDMHIDHFLRVFNTLDEHAVYIETLNGSELKEPESKMKEYVKKVIVEVFKDGTH